MLEQLANISEIVGAVIVLVSIAFLIAQIRQSTMATRSATALNLTTRMAENYRVLALNPEISSLASKAGNDPYTLTSEELVQYAAWMVHALLNFQDLYYQKHSQSYDQEQYEGFMRLLAQISKSPGFILVWKERKFVFSRVFQNFVDNELNSFDSDLEFHTLNMKPEQR